MLRRLVLAILAAVVAVPLVAHSVAAQTEPGQIDVVVVDGVIDDAMADVVMEGIEAAAETDAQAVILKVDATGAVGSSGDDLVELVASPPLPVIVWVGDAPAQALGLAARLAEVAEVATAAPGVEVGWSEYDRIGGEAGPATGPFAGAPEPVTTDDDRFGTVQAAIGQVVVWLDGAEVPYDGGVAVLETAEEVTDDDGTIRLEPVPVLFAEPGLWVRLLNAPLNPVTLVFLLSAGLAVAAFEYYALGPGVAAATALLPLLVAAYGLAQLPLAWWALALLLGGMLLMVIDYQAGAFGLWSVVGAVALAVAGRFLVDGAPLLEATWLGAGLSAAATALFFAVAMPVVARSRFSTGTFGRSHLVGAPGTVVEAFHDGAGVVEVDGARWQATAHRESQLGEGDAVEVTAVQGLWLEVDTRS